MENKETLKDVAEKIQDECHKFTESILATSNVSYQDATNTFLYMKIAELTIKLNSYEKNKQEALDFLTSQSQEMGLYGVRENKINLQEMPQEEWDEARNTAYKHFDIEDDVEKLAELNGSPDSSGFYDYKEGFVDGYWEGKENTYTEEKVIGFAEWISGKYSFGNIFGKWYLHENTDKNYTEKELFDLYIQSLKQQR